MIRRAASIGVSVKETSSETAIAKDEVNPNDDMKRPTIPPMNPTGRKTASNDKVVAVNKMGTYGFAYLDPGEYVLASQSENASAIKLNLEAGKEYYFLQNTFMGAWKARTGLSQQSKEIVLHEMSGAEYADWKRK